MKQSRPSKGYGVILVITPQNSVFFSVNAINKNVKLFFSFIKLLIMYTEQFFKYTLNCVFQCYLELIVAPLKIRGEVISAYRLI